MLHVFYLFFLFSLYSANVIFPTQITPTFSGAPTAPFSMPPNSYKFFYVDVPVAAVNFYATLKLPENVNPDEVLFKFRPWIPSPLQMTDATTPNLFHSYNVPTTQDSALYNPVPGRYYMTLFNTLKTELTGLVITANVTTCMLASRVGRYCVEPQTAHDPNLGFGFDVSTSAIQPYDQPLWTAPMIIKPNTGKQAYRSLTFTVTVTKTINVTVAEEANVWPEFYFALGAPAGPMSEVNDLRNQALAHCTYADFTVVNNQMKCAKTIDYPKSGMYYYSAFPPSRGSSLKNNLFECSGEVTTNDESYPFNFVFLDDATDFFLNSKSKDTVFYFDIPVETNPPVVSLLGCPKNYDSEENQNLAMSITQSGVSFLPAIPDVEFAFSEEWESAKPYPYWYLSFLQPGRYYFRVTGVGSGEYMVKRHFGEATSFCLGVPTKPKPPHNHDSDSGDAGADAGLVVLYILASCCFCAACLSLIGVAVGLVVTYRQALLAKYGELTGKYVAIGEKKNLYDDL